MALSKVVLHNIIMFMRRDAVSKGDEAIAYCECMDALESELSSTPELSRNKEEENNG
ncbi:hypothetical protein [Aeromonas veronii]|uniref:hypothetical protein n=1 Tax=Aeromonas veronii TaxID=654 RepID=UPI002485292B|nr:hypothetical protein [Aeromonas veronii]